MQTKLNKKQLKAAQAQDKPVYLSLLQVIKAPFSVPGYVEKGELVGLADTHNDVIVIIPKNHYSAQRGGFTENTMERQGDKVRGARYLTTTKTMMDTPNGELPIELELYSYANYDLVHVKSQTELMKEEKAVAAKVIGHTDYSLILGYNGLLLELSYENLTGVKGIPSELINSVFKKGTFIPVEFVKATKKGKKVSVRAIKQLDKPEFLRTITDDETIKENGVYTGIIVGKEKGLTVKLGEYKNSKNKTRDFVIIVPRQHGLLEQYSAVGSVVEVQVTKTKSIHSSARSNALGFITDLKRDYYGEKLYELYDFFNSYSEDLIREKKEEEEASE